VLTALLVSGACKNLSMKVPSNLPFSGHPQSNLYLCRLTLDTALAVTCHRRADKWALLVDQVPNQAGE
jgi:hypothetical protein